MNTSRFTATFLVLLASTVMLHGSYMHTRWSKLNSLIGEAYERYAKANEGKVPSKWEDLDPYWNAEWVEDRAGIKIRENTHMFAPTATLPHVDYTGKLLTMSASVIIEERSPEKGRYVVYRTGAGKIGSKWLAESVIQEAARVAGVPAPSTGDYIETSISASKKYNGGPFIAIPTVHPPNPWRNNYNAPKLNYGPYGEPLSVPVQPVQGTTALGPTTAFDGSYYGYVTAAVAALIALVGLGVRFYNDRHRPAR